MALSLVEFTPTETTRPNGTNGKHAKPSKPPIRHDRFTWTAWDRTTVASALGLVIGAPLLALSFRYAASHDTGQLQFHLFWVGFLLFAVPISWRAMSSSPNRRSRYFAVALLGAWSFLPKLLRNPGGPLYSDELAHWRQTVNVAQSGNLYPKNTLIPIIRDFPGQQGLVAAVHLVTGLSVWDCAEAMLFVLHVSSLVGMFVLGERLLGSARAGAVVAVIYALNPGFLFFDAEFSYESFGLPLLIWSIVAAVHVAEGDRSRASRRGWVALGATTGLACVVTHHLSSYILAGTLVVIATLSTLPGPWRPSHTIRGPTSTKQSRRGLWALASIVVVGSVTWALVKAPSVSGYYAPYVSGGLHQVLQILTRTHGSRHLFGGTSSPKYEVVFGFLSPVLAALGAFLSVRRLRSRLLYIGPTFVALAALSALYFVSLPLTLTTLGGEAAHRSWSFSYIGLALLVGAYVTYKLERLEKRPKRHLRRFSLVLAVMFVVVLIGNTAASVDAEYRFPGPYVYGSDTRSLTVELQSLSGWFATTYGAHVKLIADRFTGLALGAFGNETLAQPSPGFPVWDLYLDAHGPPVGLLEAVRNTGYSYLVVDKRMFTHLSPIGAYFTDSEPGAFSRTSPPSAEVLQFYQHVPWATSVYNSTNYIVFRLDLADLSRGEAS